MRDKRIRSSVDEQQRCVNGYVAYMSATHSMIINVNSLYT